MNDKRKEETLMSEDMKTRTGRRKTQQKSKKVGKNKKQLFKKIVIAFLIFSVIGFLAGGITLFAMIQGAPPLDPDRLMFSQPAQILDQDDELFTQLEATENRIRVNINDIPELVEDAFISVEDVRFREHFGIDIRRLFGAVAANVQSGFGAEGASTITQQVIKNAFLSPEKTISRKVQEQYLAVKLEQEYSKDQILEMYLNGIYFSEGAYGVQQAAITYFNKEDLEELTIADAALLAGLPQRPNHFNPLKNPEAAETRRNIVIGLMERHGKITAEEAEEARSISVEDQLNPSKRETYAYASFLDQVVSEVDSIEGISASDLYTAGLKIYTTLDQEAQQHVEAVLQTDEYIQNYPDNEDFQAGVTLLDTKTGEIKAIGGGRKQPEVKQAFNYATMIKKQPGSTIKPILDYGPGIEYHKWSTGRIFVDEPHRYTNSEQEIRNAGRQPEGPVTMRRALAVSLNIPAVKALQEVGLEEAQEFAEGLGVPFTNQKGERVEITEAYGIGGFTTGISTLDLAGAYSAFGNEGVYNQPHTVRKIEFPDGRVIHTSPEPEVAMSDYTAYMISDMLKTAVTSGTGTQAAIPNLPLAGKTGTTNFAQEDFARFNIPTNTYAVPDVWFAGYTTNYTAAVWTGYDRFGEGNYIGQNDRYIAQHIFKNVMSKVSEGKETEDFVQPDSVVRVGIERSTGLLPSDFTPESEIVYELFVKGTEPSKVSETYQKLDKPTDFMAAYNEDANQIVMSWNYPEATRDNVSFKVTQSINGGEFQTLDITNDMQFVVSNPEPGATYRFQVIAISDESPDLQSDPAQVEVRIPEDEVEIPDPVDDIPPEDDDETPPDDGDAPPPDDDDIDLPIDILPEEPEEEDDDNGNGNGNGNGGGNRGNDNRNNEEDS